AAGGRTGKWVGIDCAMCMGGRAAIYLRVSKGERHTDNQRPDVDAWARCVGSSSSPSRGAGCVNADSFLQTQQAPLEAPKLQLIRHREPRTEPGAPASRSRRPVIAGRVE